MHTDYGMGAAQHDYDAMEAPDNGLDAETCTAIYEGDDELERLEQARDEELSRTLDDDHPSVEMRHYRLIEARKEHLRWLRDEDRRADAAYDERG